MDAVVGQVRSLRLTLCLLPTRHPAPAARVHPTAPHPLSPNSQAVAPGDAVARLPSSGELRVGPGLDADDTFLTTERAGVLRRTRAGKLWVSTRSSRYTPSPGDAVLGVVTDRGGEAFAVDVGAAFPATLPALAFEGATRRNRPALNRGDAIFARVVAAPPHVDAELSCVDEAGRVSWLWRWGVGERTEASITFFF